MLAALACSAAVLADAPASGSAPRVAWLKAHATPLRTLDAGETDFSDLAAMGEKIGAARIVALGESTHGDGDAFKAKTRLIEYLHQHKGFDVLAWESNLLESVLADRALRADMPVEAAAGRGIYSVWSRAAEVQPLFEYIRSTHGSINAIEMIGFDSQSYGLMLEPLFAFLDRAYPGTLSRHDKTLLEALQRMLVEDAYARQSPEQRTPYRALLDRLITATAEPNARTGERQRRLMHRTLQSLRDFQHAYSVTLTQEEIRKGGEAGNRRDISMGRNLAWLANAFYPDRKIIAWAANTHLARKVGDLDGFGANKNILDNYLPMGEVARELLGEAIYSIGFIAYSGTSSHVNRDTVTSIRAPPGSLEALCHLTGHEYLFIDLKHTPSDHWLRQDLVTGAFGFMPMIGRWAEVFDAFIFIDEMHPATPLERRNVP